MPTAAIFGGSNFKPDSIESQTAEKIARKLAEKGFDICTGGYGGVMEAALKGAAEFPVKRIGVGAESLAGRKFNKYVSVKIVAKNYMARLEKLIEIGDVYIVLPGGSGSLLELAAVWALKERGEIPDKTIICVGEQWSEVVQTIGFYSEKTINQFDIIKYADSARDAAAIVFRKFDIEFEEI